MRLGDLGWLAVQGVAVSVQALVIVITAVLAYRQLKQAARSAQFDAVVKMQSMVDAFCEDREKLFASLPLDLALDDAQFSNRPPTRQRLTRLSEGQRRKMILSDSQAAALASLDEDQRGLVRRVISRLNDLGELVEDGFLPKEVFFGKYHLLILRCCHLVEAVRRDIEEHTEGGNYGQRLLRLRHRASVYNDIMPKHRDVGVYIRNRHGRRLVYESPERSAVGRIPWAVRRWSKLY